MAIGYGDEGQDDSMVNAHPALTGENSLMILTVLIKMVP